jgi:protein-tyrosine-phosphatase
MRNLRKSRYFKNSNKKTRKKIKGGFGLRFALYVLGAIIYTVAPIASSAIAELTKNDNMKSEYISCEPPGVKGLKLNINFEPNLVVTFPDAYPNSLPKIDTSLSSNGLFDVLTPASTSITPASTSIIPASTSITPASTSITPASTSITPASTSITPASTPTSIITASNTPTNIYKYIEYIIAVCAGNTCRSPIAEYIFKMLLKKSYNYIFSRGVNVRIPNSEMAPYSKYFATQTCNGDLRCIKDVSEHKSTPFSIQEIIALLQSNPLATVKIVAMDDDVSSNVVGQLHTYFNNIEDKKIIKGFESRIKIGYGNGNETSVKAPDPYWDRNTPKERESYIKTYNIINYYSNENNNKCPRSEYQLRFNEGGEGEMIKVELNINEYLFNN